MTGVAAVTVPAVTVKAAEIDPCGIDTVAGTLADGVLELESDITAPPAPASAVRLTVPDPVWPLTITLGLTAILLRVGVAGLTVRANVWLTPE